MADADQEHPSVQFDVLLEMMGDLIEQAAAEGYPEEYINMWHVEIDRDETGDVVVRFLKPTGWLN